MGFKLKFEDNDLYNIAKDPNIPKQHPENDRGKKKIFLFLKIELKIYFDIGKIIIVKEKQLKIRGNFFNNENNGMAVYRLNKIDFI